jgi:acyl dehydratase
MSSVEAAMRGGEEIASAPYRLDADAAHAYGQAIEGAPRRQPPRNIHSDTEAARTAGFEAPIAGGEQTLAVMVQLLVDRFGTRFVEGGRIEIAFTRPVLFGDTITAHARVVSAASDRIGLELRVENQRGEQVLAGTASVRAHP